MWLGVKCCVSEHLCLFYFLILLVIAGNIFHGEDFFWGGWWEVLIIFVLTFLNLENEILLWVTIYEHKTFMLIED